MAVSPSLLASVAHLTDDIKCEPVVHSRHVDASAPRAAMLANLLDEEPDVAPNDVLALSQGFRAKSVREGSSLRPVLLGIDREDDVRVHDGGTSIVKDSALEEWLPALDGVPVDVFVGLRGIEAELVGCNPDHVAVFIMRPPHIKWIVSSRPSSDEPELRRLELAFRFAWSGIGSGSPDCMLQALDRDIQQEGGSRCDKWPRPRTRVLPVEWKRLLRQIQGQLGRLAYCCEQKGKTQKDGTLSEHRSKKAIVQNTSRHFQCGRPRNQITQSVGLCLTWRA